MNERQGLFADSTGRAAVGAIIGGPVGVVTALVVGGPLVLVTAAALIAGSLAGALTGDAEDGREAAIDAILPIGVWLVGAAIAWVILGTFHEDLPLIFQHYPLHAALGAAVLGGTVAVLLLIVRLARPKA